MFNYIKCLLDAFDRGELSEDDLNYHLTAYNKHWIAKILEN